MAKHPGGRPPKRKEDCLPTNWKEIIYDLSAQGCSDVEIRAKLCLAGGKFSLTVWNALKERDQEFCEVIRNALILCQAWWEEQGRVNLGVKGFQTALWFINMKNRFGWTDNREQRVSIEDADKHFKTIADAISKSDTDTT
jgi:hypothetical protein